MLARLTAITTCVQGQLTVAKGVLFGTTSSSDDSLTASLFALNITDGTILTAVTLNNTLVQNGPSIVNNILYQGAGECSRPTLEAVIPFVMQSRHAHSVMPS